ncbi:MAG: DNA polymerase III subunit [FCB group bacterium]|nr:DNA polymerase III subunit [FCB group bacterium]
MVTKEINISVPDLQPVIWKKLARVRQTNRVGSAYLFTGPPGCGKEALAIAFAKLLNCESPSDTYCGSCPSCHRFATLQHEHLKLVVPLPAAKSTTDKGSVLDKLSQSSVDFLTKAIQEKARNPFHKIMVPKASRIRIDSIRELRKTLYFKSQVAGQKMVLIFDAHLLSAGQGEAANALLKILEEPPDRTTLVLVTDHKADLLPTIVSRCQQVDFPPLETAVVRQVLEQQMEADQAKFIAGLAQGDMHRALSLSQRATEELLSMMKNLALAVVRADGAEWRKFVSNLSRLATSNPDEYIFNLYLLQLWFKSAYRLRIGLEDELHLESLLGDLHSFNTGYPNADLHRVGEQLEEAITAMARNHYLPLTLINLLIGIQRSLSK